MSNTNKKNQQKQQHHTKPVPTPPTNRKFAEAVEAKPAKPTVKTETLLGNLTEALEVGNITQAEFDKFVQSQGYAPKEKEIDTGNYSNDIISMMKQFEEALPTRALVERKHTVKQQGRLWAIVSTCVQQKDYSLFKEGYRTIINRFKEQENYTVQYLFRGLANPVDPTPVFETHTITLYNLMAVTARKGIKGALLTIDLDKVTANMPEQARNNLVQFYTL